MIQDLTDGYKDMEAYKEMLKNSEAIKFFKSFIRLTKKVETILSIELLQVEKSVEEYFNITVCFNNNGIFDSINLNFNISTDTKECVNENPEIYSKLKHIKTSTELIKFLDEDVPNPNTEIILYSTILSCMYELERLKPKFKYISMDRKRMASSEDRRVRNQLFVKEEGLESVRVYPASYYSIKSNAIKMSFSYIDGSEFSFSFIESQSDYFNLIKRKFEKYIDKESLIETIFLKMPENFDSFLE